MPYLRPQPAGVFRHVAADGGDFHRTRVRRIKKPGGRGGVGDLQGGDAGFDQHREVGAVQFQDLAHFHGAKHDAIRAGQTAAAQTRARTAGDDGDFGGIGKEKNLAHLLRIGSEDHAAGHLPQSGGGIEGVRDQIFLRRENIRRAHPLLQIADDAWSQHRRQE
jgi:hypothetical protein